MARTEDGGEASKRPTSDEILARIQQDEKAGGDESGDHADGRRLKLFLGFAAGVGKTYEMLQEAKRRKERGQDVVVGFVETHGRKGTAEQLEGLEIVPRKKIEYKGVALEEMDLDAVLARKPRCVLVDELAHTNVPGSKNEKRYQDVLEITKAGITVLSTMNVQHLESLNDVVQQITGVKVRETVPDWVLGEAEEIMTIDISPRALINRIERGDVYPSEKVPLALRNFFTEGNLSALREIALREVASEVDRSIQSYREEHHVTEPWPTHERIMVCISPNHSSEKMLRRGWRVARRLRADLLAAYVSNGRLTQEQQRIVDTDFALAQRLNIRVEQLTGGDIAEALAEYATQNQVTEIIIGHSARPRLQEILHGSIVNRLISAVPDIDVLVVSNTR